MLVLPAAEGQHSGWGRTYSVELSLFGSDDGLSGFLLGKLQFSGNMG